MMDNKWVRLAERAVKSLENIDKSLRIIAKAEEARSVNKKEEGPDTEGSGGSDSNHC